MNARSLFFYCNNYDEASLHESQKEKHVLVRKAMAQIRPR